MCHVSVWCMCVMWLGVYGVGVGVLCVHPCVVCARRVCVHNIISLSLSLYIYIYIYMQCMRACMYVCLFVRKRCVSLLCTNHSRTAIRRPIIPVLYYRPCIRNLSNRSNTALVNPHGTGDNNNDGTHDKNA